MSDAANAQSTQEMALLVLATLHVVPYLRWEREGEFTFDTQRAQLLDILTRLIPRLRTEGDNALKHLLLGGQTAILEDIAALRPDILNFLIVCNANHRVELGPWYVIVDDTLVSGEALVRNLLAARMDADRLGIVLSPIAYTPDAGGHVAQLPQILRGFGIDAAFAHHGAPVVHLPFRWEAPDGSNILVLSHDTPQRQNAALSVRDQRGIKPDGPFLWMATADDPEKLKPAGVSLPTITSSLETYVATLRKSFSDELRPILRGELRLQSRREGGYLLPGTVSARMYLKQRNAQLQSLLTYAAEPWLTLALTHSKVEAADNVRALLNHSWRLLMKNQARATLGGYAADAVHEEAEVRYRQAEDAAQHVIQRALTNLPGTLHQQGKLPLTMKATYVVVWNAHNWDVRQVVEMTLDLPEGTHPIKLQTPQGNAQAFGWQPETRQLRFIANAPAVGYATYTILLGEITPSEMLIQRSTAPSIADSAGATLSAETGELVWRYGNAQINHLLRFVSGGDAGDVFNYSPPKEDVIEEAVLVSGIQAESSPVHERLTMRHRMRVAPALRADRRRERGVRLLELTTTATFYDGMPGLYFHTTYTNTAEDHRLRVHLKTGIQADTVLADSAFGIVARPTQLTGHAAPPAARMESTISTYPMRGAAAVQDTNGAMALLARGLPEFEALEEHNQTTLALTLLRAVGWTSRDDLQTRAGAIGRVRESTGAQCLRTMTAEYGLLPLKPDNPAAMMRASQLYTAPLQAYQYHLPPDKLSRSYLSIQTSLGSAGASDGNGAILTALKPPQNGRGWVLRLLNPTNETVEVSITPNVRPKYARLTNLAEEPDAIIEPDGNGTLHLVLAPQKIATVRLSFG